VELPPDSGAGVAQHPRRLPHTSSGNGFRYPFYKSVLAVFYRQNFSKSDKFSNMGL
jgi:hypothetical protein